MPTIFNPIIFNITDKTTQGAAGLLGLEPSGNVYKLLLGNVNDLFKVITGRIMTIDPSPRVQSSQELRSLSYRVHERAGRIQCLTERDRKTSCAIIHSMMVHGSGTSFPVK